MTSNIIPQKIKLKRPFPKKTELLYAISVDTASEQPDTTQIGYYYNSELLGVYQPDNCFIKLSDMQEKGIWKLYNKGEAENYLVDK